jgi:hypothetical protein
MPIPDQVECLGCGKTLTDGDYPEAQLCEDCFLWEVKHADEPIFFEKE